jgi:hypothetical protein
MPVNKLKQKIMKALTSVSKWLKQKMSSKPKIETKTIVMLIRNTDINEIPSHSHIQNYLSGSPEFYPKRSKRKGYMNSKSTFNKNK